MLPVIGPPLNGAHDQMRPNLGGQEVAATKVAWRQLPPTSTSLLQSLPLLTPDPTQRPLQRSRGAVRVIFGARSARPLKGLAMYLRCSIGWTKLSPPLSILRTVPLTSRKGRPVGSPGRACLPHPGSRRARWLGRPRRTVRARRAVRAHCSGSSGRPPSSPPLPSPAPSS